MIDDSSLIKDIAEWAVSLSVPDCINSVVMEQEEIHPAKPASYYRFFYHYAKTFKPMLCVELGTNRGVGAACLALGNPSGKVITYDIVKKDLNEAVKLPNVEFLVQDSLGPIRDDIKDIDVLFIDTSSKGSQNKKEFEHWFPRLKKDAVVFIDDIYIIKDISGNITTDLMAEFWQEFSPKGEKFSLPLHGVNGFGCVVLNTEVDLKAKNQTHKLLKDIHKGEDVYVLGSGNSMSFIDKTFFEGKITIGANMMLDYLHVKYSVVKHKQFIEQMINKGSVVIASKHDCGDIDKDITDTSQTNFVFTHKRGRFGELETNFVENINSVGKDDDIFVSYSTITSCIHLAAYMGAKNIILCGHDCGWIDGRSHIEGYHERLHDFHNTDEKFNEYHNGWFERIEKDSIRLKDKLKEVYGCNVYSLNPFINFKLEGHVFSKEE